jgi:hypothetical protein
VGKSLDASGAHPPRPIPPSAGALFVPRHEAIIEGPHSPETWATTDHGPTAPGTTGWARIRTSPGETRSVVLGRLGVPRERAGDSTTFQEPMEPDIAAIRPPTTDELERERIRRRLEEFASARPASPSVGTRTPASGRRKPRPRPPVKSRLSR